jgi:hypothetical protein
LHKRIQTEQERIREILDALIYKKPIKKDLILTDAELDHNLLSQYLEIYNKMPRSIIEFDQQDILKERYPILEEDYLRINLPLKWLGRITSDLAYCLVEFLLSEYQKNLKRCDVCSKLLMHPTRKRCPGECTRIATKQYDTEYKQDDRWEQFVSDVKQKCKTVDDLHRNPKLMRRARSFRFGLEGVIERLKDSKVLESPS